MGYQPPRTMVEHLDAFLLSIALERVTIERFVLARCCGRSSAISRSISWNLCRGMPTSAIWKTT
jgi:hypothetical protein